MNLYFVHDDGTIVTPETSGTILEGITRSSIIELCGKLGHRVEERPLTIDEWRDGVASGRITEVFACGTAAVVTPVGTLKWRGGSVGEGEDDRPGHPAGPHRAGRHPVRPRRGHLRLDAPGRLSSLAAGARPRGSIGQAARLPWCGGDEPAAAAARDRGDPRGRLPTCSPRSARAAWGSCTSRRPRDGSRVALKVLRPHIIGDDEARERLAREVASLRRVTSPRIAEVIDADPWGETPYVATRYVPGLSLHEHVRQEGPVTGDDLRALRGRPGRGGHRRAPGRACCTATSSRPTCCSRGAPRCSSTSAWPGSPRTRGSPRPAGCSARPATSPRRSSTATTRPPASDMHSWAATVVFAATGRPPFGTGPAMAIMDRVRRGEHDLSAVPADLLPVVRACLAPDPLGPARRPRRCWARCGPASPLRRAGPRRADHAVALATPDAAGPPTTATHPAAAPTARPCRPSRAHRPRGPSVLQPARAPYMQPAGAPAASRRRARTRPPLLPPHGLAARRPAGCPGCSAARCCWGCSRRSPSASRARRTSACSSPRSSHSSCAPSPGPPRQRGSGSTCAAAAAGTTGPLTLATSPWYLVVATGGTLMLLLWSAFVAFVVGFAYLLFRAPLVPGLLVMGAVFAASLWWGPACPAAPGADPAAACSRATRDTCGSAGSRVALVATAAVLCGYALVSGGVVWSPQPGAPWRSGTLLGRLLGWL